MEFRQTQLGNALTVIGEVNGEAASMAMGFFVQTGSRDETPDVAGVSHFLEHMMFKGTDRRSAAEVNLAFDRLGAQYNASTSEENTIYYGAVLPEFQADLLDVLGDMMRPALRGADFDMEKNVIIDEIARYEDMPAFRVFEKLMAVHFAGHPLANSVLGTTESITALRRDQMQTYFDQQYSPGNVTLVGVGKLDFDAFVAQAGELCGAWAPFDVHRLRPPCRGQGATKVIADPKVVRQHVAMMSAAPPGNDEDRYAAQLAATIFGDVTGSRLYYALVDPALVDEAHCSYEAMDGTGAFVTTLSCDPERARQVVDVTMAEMTAFVKEGPTQSELEAARNKLASIITVKGEAPMGRLVSVGLEWVYRHDYMPMGEQIDRLFAITLSQVRDVLARYDLRAVSTAALGPLETL
ncbi:MAG: pitrilysin family protein [Planctomycetota bacterium]|nr:pitrilysin family protein [Planctomycetota bacterium]